MFVGEVDPRSRTQRSSVDSQMRDSTPNPLERRVSFCGPCAATASAPDDPRNSFMKFCETDDIQTTRFLTQPACASHSLRVGPVNINLAFQICAFFNRDA